MLHAEIALAKGMKHFRKEMLASFPGSHAREHEHWSCAGDTYSRSGRAWERG